MKLEYSHKYDDIINMEHHKSKKHPPMSLYARSAQFAPFAALTGYEDAVTETAREVGERIDIDDELSLSIINPNNDYFSSKENTDIFDKLLRKIEKSKDYKKIS